MVPEDLLDEVLLERAKLALWHAPLFCGRSQYVPAEKQLVHDGLKSLLVVPQFEGPHLVSKALLAPREPGPASLLAADVVVPVFYKETKVLAMARGEPFSGCHRRGGKRCYPYLLVQIRVLARAWSHFHDLIEMTANRLNEDTRGLRRRLNSDHPRKSLDNRLIFEILVCLGLFIKPGRNKEIRKHHLKGNLLDNKI